MVKNRMFFARQRFQLNAHGIGIKNLARITEA
jgi:hypothetical protein